MSTIIPFSFKAHAVRVVFMQGEPWFVPTDVCEVLEIVHHRDAAARLDEDERGSVVVDTLGGPQETIAVSESGLYNLIFTSRKSEAKRFRKWVTGEVLPAIRKTGSYALPTSKEDWFNRFARILCLWDASGETAARHEWQTTGLPCPMPHAPCPARTA